MNSNIERYQTSISNGVEYVIDTDKNIPYATLSACERMFPGVPKTTLHRRLKGVPFLTPISVKVVTSGGKQGVPLYSAEVVLDLALEFDRPLARKMGLAGATIYMFGMAGYQVKAIAPDLPLTPKQLALCQKRVDAREFKVTEAERLREEISLVLDVLVLLKYDSNTSLVILIDRWARKNAESIFKCHRLQIKPMKLDRLGNRHHTPVCVTNKIAMLYGYRPKLYSKANNTRSYQLTAPHESLVCQ